MQKWKPCALLPSMTGKVHCATLKWRRCAGQQLPPGAWPDSLGGAHDAAAAADPAHTVPANGRGDGPLTSGTPACSAPSVQLLHKMLLPGHNIPQKATLQASADLQGAKQAGPRDALGLLCHSRCWCGAPTSGTVPQTALCNAC